MRRAVMVWVNALVTLSAFAQTDTTTRHLQLQIAKNESLPFTIVVQKNDTLKIEWNSAKKDPNLRFTRPSGKVTELILKEDDSLQLALDSGGVCQFEVQNSSRFSTADVNLTLCLIRGLDTCLAYKLLPSDNLSASTFQLSRKQAKEYPFVMEKGEVLQLDLQAASKPFGSVQVRNDKEELVLSARNQKSVKQEIPILESGTYTLAMESKSFLAKEFKARVAKRPVEVEVKNNCEEKPPP